MKPEDLARIHAEAFPASGGWSAREIANLLKQNSVFLIAESAGFAVGRIAADEAELLTLAVLPAHQGQGVGARLLSTFSKEAHVRGAASAFLEVADDNCAARALYDSAGFQQTGRRKSYYARSAAEAADALVLRKDLSHD
jgi:ribosomal-protein-alanine N-acetyltransferase